MATPAKFRAAFIKALSSALPALIDEAWKQMEEGPALSPPLRKREATAKAKRMAKNVVRVEVKELITQNHKDGLTRRELRRLLVHQLKTDVRESTLKRALMDLRAREEIETRNSRWHLAPRPFDK